MEICSPLAGKPEFRRRAICGVFLSWLKMPGGFLPMLQIEKLPISVTTDFSLTLVESWQDNSREASNRVRIPHVDIQ